MDSSAALQSDNCFCFAIFQPRYCQDRPARLRSLPDNVFSMSMEQPIFCGFAPAEIRCFKSNTALWATMGRFQSGFKTSIPSSNISNMWTVSPPLNSWISRISDRVGSRPALGCPENALILAVSVSRPKGRSPFRIYDHSEKSFLHHPSMSGVVSVGANLSPLAWQRITLSTRNWQK